MVCTQFINAIIIFKFIILGNTASHTLKIGDKTIKSASSVTLLGILLIQN